MTIAPFPVGEGGSVDTHLFRGRFPLSLAAPGRLVREQRDGTSWSKRAACDQMMVAVGRVWGSQRGKGWGQGGTRGAGEKAGVTRLTHLVVFLEVMSLFYFLNVLVTGR